MINSDSKEFGLKGKREREGRYLKEVASSFLAGRCSHWMFVAPLVDSLNEPVEYFVDVVVRFGRRFDIATVQFFGQVFALLGGDRSFLFQINFVRNEHDRDIRGVLFYPQNLLLNLCCMIEACRRGHAVD